MNNNYSFNEKMQILKSLNENLINKYILLDNLKVRKYDMIFETKNNEMPTIGDEVLLVLWNISKDYIQKKEVDKLKFITENFANLLGYLSSELKKSHDQITQDFEVANFIEAAKINRLYFNKKVI